MWVYIHIFFSFSFYLLFYLLLVLKYLVWKRKEVLFYACINFSTYKLVCQVLLHHFVKYKCSNTTNLSLHRHKIKQDFWTCFTVAVAKEMHYKICMYVCCDMWWLVVMRLLNIFKPLPILLLKKVVMQFKQEIY